MRSTVASRPLGIAADIENAGLGRAEGGDFTGADEGCRQHHHHGVDIGEEAQRLALVGDAVLGADDGLVAHPGGKQPLSAGRVSWLFMQRKITSSGAKSISDGSATQREAGAGFALGRAQQQSAWT